MADSTTSPTARPRRLARHPALTVPEEDHAALRLAAGELISAPPSGPGQSTPAPSYA